MATRLFNSKNSMFCEKLRVVLSMKKVPYDVVDVRADERKSLLAFSNQRKVPTMDFDGQCIQDSTHPGQVPGRESIPSPPSTRTTPPTRGYA